MEDTLQILLAVSTGQVNEIFQNPTHKLQTFSTGKIEDT